LRFENYLSLGLACSLLFSCGSDSLSLPDSEDLAFQKLERSEFFWFPTAGHFVIGDQERYDDLIAKYWQSDTTPPKIDFQQHSLIGVHYGAHHSGCSNEVDVIRQVRKFLGSTSVIVDALPPPGICDAIIAPHHLVLIPRLNGPIFFTNQAPAIEAKAAPFDLVPNFEHFQVTEPDIRTYRTQAEWLALWETAWTLSDDQGRTPPPEVDFGRFMVIAVFYGSGYSGCSPRVELVEKLEETCPIACGSNSLRMTLRPLPDDLGGCREAVTPLTMIMLEQSDLPLLVEGPRPD